MKNLIFNQHVQKARWLLILSMLLTLGVGEMKANTYKITGEETGWGTWKDMTVSADGFYEYYKITNKSGSCKINTSASYTNALGGSYVDAGFNSTNITDTWSGDNANFWDDTRTYYVLIYYKNTTVNSTSNPKICAATYLPDNRSCTVYFVDEQNWAGTLSAYAWYYQNSTTGSNNASWPGQTMTSTGKTYNGKTIYYKTLSQTYDKLIVTNKTAGSSQTADLTLGTTNKGKMYDNTSSSPTWKTLAYDVTLNQQSGSGGTSSIIATCGSAMPDSKTAPTRTGYTFGGYYTNTGGSGTKYYNADMTSAATWPSDGSGPTTLYAKWTKITYTVTVSNDGHGTTTPSGEQASVAQVDGVAISASANDGYEFVNWTITSGTGSFTSATSASTTFYPTGAATIQANFRSTATNSLTVVAGAGISSVTGSTDPITLGNSYAISATPLAGYTFSTWTADVPANASFASATSASTNVNVSNGSVTVTASATEAKRTLTPTVSYNHGSSDYTATSANTLGVVTTSVLTASTPNAAHYTFAGWTLTNLIVTSGDKDNDLSITVKVDNPASACSAVANYAEVLTSSWYINSDNSSPFTGWGTAGNRMSKKSGHSTEEIYYCTLNITDPRDYAIKMYNDAGAGNKYYQDKNDGGTSKSIDVGSCNGVAFALDNANDKPNMTFKAYLAGEYEFKLDNTGASPTLTITWPEINQLRVSNASPTNAENVGNFDLCAPVSNVRSVTRSLAANTTYTFKIVYNSDWYGFNSGTFTRSTSTSSNSRTLSTSGGDMTLTTDYAGDYTFKFNQSTKELSVDFPEAYQIHFERGAINGGKVSSYPIATQVETSTSVTSDVTWVKAGNTVTLSAAAVKDGGHYIYFGWYTVKNPDRENPTTNRLGTSLAYTTPKITSSSNKNFYAVYFETKYWVTISNSGNGSVDPNGANAFIETPTEFEAEADHGWKFYNWTIPANVTAKSGYSASSNPLIVNATAAATLTANFQPRWGLFGANLPGNSSWSDDNYQIEDNFYESPASSGKYEGQEEFTLAANTTYQLKVKDRKVGDMYGFASGAADVDIYYSESNTYSTLTNASGNGNVYLHSAAQGTYTFKWNEDTKKLAVDYPASWYITTGVNDADGGSFTAVDNSSNNVYGGKYVANSANVVFTATANTGYDFAGWYSNSTCTTAYTAGTGVAFSGEGNTVMTLSGITADKTVYAKFTAKTYNVALDMQTSAEGYGSGSNRNETVTYNATLTTVGSLPTAENGYAFMGFYSGTGGRGTQFINASGTWATSVTDTISDSKWVLDAGATLYAYYKKAEITELTVSPSTVGTGEEVTATPTIYPTPTGSYKVCWKILRNNGNVLTEDGFSEGDDDAVTFDAPTVSGTYKVACVLRTGSACNGGIVLDSVVTDFVVAGIHTVAVRYQDTDDRTLAASTEVSAKPLEWSDDITAPSITGYTFSYWNAGDGITLKTANNVNPTQIKANYGGNLTAVYTKKKMVYFNNTLGWSDVYVYFYNDGDGNEYWANNYGTGANKQQSFNGNKPYWEAQFGHMTQIEGTDIWYYDYLAAGVPSGRTKVAFATVSQSIDKSGASNDEAYFHNASVVYRTDFDGTNLPMFVPINSVVHDYTANTGSKYYRGYWMNYPNNTGYTLKIFDKVSGTPAPVQVQSIPFEFTGDLTMPMSVTAELEGGRTYGFKIYRNDATWWGNNGTMKISSSGDTGQAVWEFTTDKNNCGLTTSVAGDYTFTLTYGAKSGTYYYLVGVHYPVAKNDYRIMYKDLATWSQGSAHTAAWGHPSRAIHKEDGAKDIVSFYVSKATGASATMKFQYASAISNEGVVTWTDVTSGSIDLSGIEESGVYNFHLTQADGAISVDKIEKYDGNYYIRTDCAGTTKWDNYRADDHKMSYSEFSMSSANSFGEKYSHYYTHWCPRGTNVKFVVANDYSSCVSDTLIRDVGDPYSNIYENDGGGRADGELKAETYSGTTPSSDPTADKYSANIRFMYNESTNKISRAYLSSSTNQSRKFLVLKGEAEFWNSDGTNLSGTGESHANHEAIFVDDEDWIYEREIKVTPGTLFKLYACYAQSSPDASTAQYFRGSYDSGDFTEDVNSIVLIGGTGSASKTRIVYDFKTNRLMAAYQPEEGDIDGVQSIKADIMLVREHQKAGQQLTFKDESSKLTEVKTVYGVMRFNRWTLNNRANPEDHDKDHSDTDGDITTYHPLLDAGSQKSTSERGLYWISFPFDVNLSEVFGFGTYGRHWAIMYYDGAARAEKGYWTDSEGFWEFYEDRKDVTLKAGKGYVLGLDLDLMKANDRDFWANEIQQVELFFPSTASAGTIQQTNATVSVPSHECTIDRTGNNGSDINKNRKIADSHWNVIGVPSYANYGSTLSDGTNTITWHAPNTNNLPFLYEWNMADNSYTPQTGSTYSFKAMHAYMVQYQGTLVWSLASATPSSPVARRANELPQQNIEFRLELQQNDKMTDQTFVKLSDNEEVSANFAFDEDMMKEMNQGKANIYTMVEGYIPTAGNTLPMREQTTVVPVGVKIATNGDYTFSIPDGTSGVGVTLIDTEKGIRTNLSAVDYTVSLESGQNDNRFVLEISPIQHIATEIETSDIGDQQSDVRKLLIDGLLYIVRDGKVYDARGARIE